MNDRTSRRSFVALATGALASLAAGLGRAFGHGPVGCAAALPDAAPCDALADGLSVTTYTFDAQSRLISVTEPAGVVATTLRYADRTSG